jgi:hypothetical protein
MGRGGDCRAIRAQMPCEPVNKQEQGEGGKGRAGDWHATLLKAKPKLKPRDKNGVAAFCSSRALPCPDQTENECNTE